MFGSHRRKRERKKLKKERKAFEQEKALFETGRPQAEAANEQATKQMVAKNAEEAKLSRQKARKEGREYARDVVGQDVQGLTPKQRSAMQYEANKGIQRATQSANRRLVGEQGQRGIRAGSGVAYAQQRDLQRLGNEARGQSQRDIDRHDADLALKKLAAMFNIEQGEASQSQLDRQMAQDELQNAEEKRRNRFYEDKFSRLFTRA